MHHHTPSPAIAQHSSDILLFLEMSIVNKAMRKPAAGGNTSAEHHSSHFHAAGPHTALSPPLQQLQSCLVCITAQQMNLLHIIAISVLHGTCVHSGTKHE